MNDRELGEQRAPAHELIYGRNPVHEALRGRRQVHAVLLASSGGKRDLEDEVTEWFSGPPRGRPQIRRLTSDELGALVGTADHQGIAAEVDDYPYLDPGAILADRDLVVALDEVQDPHNLGAIIRTAEAVGAGVVIPRHRAAEVSGAVVKVSAGATEHAAVARVRNMADFLLNAKKAGYWIYGACAGTNELYAEQDYRYPTCFVVGSEGGGLRRRVASVCDVLVSLPLAGRVDSLNVSVAAGILLYEAVRQRASGTNQP